MVTLLLATALAQSVPLPGMSSLPAADVTGVWNVITRPSGKGTCNAPPGVTTYIWVVAMQPNGSVSVSVQGQTNFPVLTGWMSGDTLNVSGPGATESNLQPNFWFELAVSGSSAKGRRLYLGGNALNTEKTLWAACFSESVVEAVKQ